MEDGTRFSIRLMVGYMVLYPYMVIGGLDCGPTAVCLIFQVVGYEKSWVRQAQAQLTSYREARLSLFINITIDLFIYLGR